MGHQWQERGSRGLEAHLEAEALRAQPEFKRKRPKYYYYYEWMRERLHSQCGRLPAAVEDKLLTLDATELDMLLTHPKGIQQQVCSVCTLPHAFVMAIAAAVVLAHAEQRNAVHC